MNESKNTKEDEVNESYEAALEALLNSPLHQSRSKTALEKAAARRKFTVHDMRTYMKRISLEEFPKHFKVVHITGTKGKGSTSSMCEAILREHYGWKTGLFTSPHLVDIRERIRINGLPVSKQVFAQAYWTIRKRLEKFEEQQSELPILPGYFRMLALMALFVFAKYEPELDVIILEVGMGGRYDATNVLDMEGRKMVCGVTLLDYDHCRVLGDTLEKIAWEKGGIFQAVKGSGINSNDEEAEEKDPSFFAIDSNTEGVLSVLKTCAMKEGKGRKLKIVGNRTKLVPEDAVIGLQGKHQRINAELAVHLCEAITRSDGSNDKKRKPEEGIFKALAEASWPGRCQTVGLTNAELPTELRLDGAHTPISLQAGFDWFSSVSNDISIDGSNVGPAKRILIFNCGHERNPVELLELLLPSSDDVRFDAVYFCRSDVERPSVETKMSAQDLLEKQGLPVKKELLPISSAGTVTWQSTLEAIWKHLQDGVSEAETFANLSVAEALNEICRISDSSLSRVEVFLTGSLLLVGSALKAIGWSELSAQGKLQV